MTATNVELFVADGGSGPVLWRTDGTAAGTYALSGPGAADLALVDGTAYFETPDGQGPFGQQSQIWRTDGTAAGTVPIGVTQFDDSTGLAVVNGLTVYLGVDGETEALFASSGAGPARVISDLYDNAGELYSAQFQGVVGGEAFLGFQQQFWETDGTAAGTHQVNTGSLSFSNNSSIVVVNGKGFFTAQVGTSIELIETDGHNFTAVTDPAIVGAGVSGPLMTLNGQLVFTGSNGLVVWDGVSSSATVIAGGDPQVVGDSLYFIAPDQQGANFGSALWVTDGTAAGTHEVANGSVGAFAQVGSRYVMDDSAGGRNGLFVSDGTGASTTLVLVNVNPSSFTVAGGEAFFQAQSGLWESNGTVAGTRLVQAFTSMGGAMSAVNGELLFSATTSPNGQGLEPWVSDGTSAGTHQLAQIHPSEAGDLTVSNIVSLGAGIAFVGVTADDGEKLWTSDGTAGGTVQLTSAAQPLVGQTSVSPPMAIGNTIYYSAGSGALAVTGGTTGSVQLPLGDHFFTAFDGKLFAAGGGNGIGVSDGTVAGTVSTLNYGVVSQPAVLGNEVLFLGNGEGHSGLFATDGTEAGTSFIASVPMNVTPSGITMSGAQGYFVATDPATGAELWVTDGTAAGTHLIEDIAPGVDSASPTNLTPFDGGLAFDATDDTHGNQLWFTNGTLGGTFQLDINQTRNAAASLVLDGGAAFAYGGKTWFVANDGVHGEVLYSTDGTAAGTTAVAVLNPDATQTLQTEPSGPAVTEFVQLQDGDFLLLQSGELWVSDGTTAGTTQLNPGFSDPQSVAEVDGAAFVLAGANADQLWVTDGTVAGTQSIGGVDLTAEFGGYAVAGGDLIYNSYDPTDGRGLFAYNVASNTSSFLGSVDYDAAFATDVGGQLGVGTPANYSSQELWITDGTAAGTFLLVQSSSIGFSGFTTLNNQLYFTGGSNLWVSDGTVAGTHQIAGLTVNFDGSLTPLGNELYFVATQSNVTNVWAYNPATGTAAPVAAGQVDSIPTDFTPVGSGGFFVASDHTSQEELWHVGATGVVTELTSPSNGELQPPTGPSFSLAVVGQDLFFTADDTTHGQSLFVTNGATITFLAQVSNVQDMSAVGNELYFQGSDATNGAELWMSDGTPSGTRRVTDTETAGNANATDLVAVGNELFFSANDGVHGQELWMFNGQPGGATMVADIDPGAAGSNPTSLTAMGADAYFIADNGSGEALWRSDGTAGGTTAITSASNGGSPQDLTAVGSQLFFFGSDPNHGSGLFVSTGAAASPTFVASFSSVADLTASDGELYFQGTTAAGTELWVSDGTAAGTVKLSSTGFDPGSDPISFTQLGGSPEGPTATSPRDFNGDGASDILFAQSDGTLADWLMSGTSITGGGALGNPGGTWHALATGDFNDDGRADILFADGSGNLAIWEMNGTSIIGGGAIGNPGGTWRVAGVGDFNGDGLSDILFQDGGGNLAIWEMNGTSIIGGGAIGNPGGTWAEKAIGDFNGDGKSDILFQDAAGDLATWEMSGTNIVGGGDIGNPGPGWTVEGTGDFNGDGMSDILFQNSSTGDYAIWEMNGTTIIGGGDIGNPGSNWSFAGIGDYNGDGHADILFTDAAGDLAIWEMNGTQIIGGGQIGNPGSVWHVLG